MRTREKIVPIISAIAIQLCLGVAYLWSIFQTGIANSIFGGDNAKAGLTFSLLLAMLTIGSVIGGKLAQKYSTRVVVIIGGIILFIGFFLAGFTTSKAPWMLWVTYGILGGIGMGFTYSTSIACAQNWYPEKKGLVTGIIVSALGFGGVVFTPIIEKLIVTFGGVGKGEMNTFIILSFLFLIVCTIGGIFMKNPPVSQKTEAQEQTYMKKSYSPMEMIKTPEFYLAAITFMLACMGGLMMIGFAKPIAVAKGLASTATIGVLAISLFNSVGRLVWGMVSDRLGRKNTIIILLIGTSILSLSVNMFSGYAIYVVIGLIGFFYGGFLSIYPAFTADMFGTKHTATNYGFMLLGFGIGAIVSSQIAGYYKNIAKDDISLMFPAFLIAAISAIIGIVLMIIVKKIRQK